MRLLRAAGVAAAGIALVGCGSPQTHQQRDAVNSYLTRIDAAEAPLIAQTAPINLAFRAFSFTSNSTAEVGALDNASALFASTLRAASSIKAPPAAAHLRDDLVRLLTLEDGVASDLVWTTRYVPQFTLAVTPLSAASTALSRSIAPVRSSSASTTAPPSKAASNAADSNYAAAFARYAAVLDRVHHSLDELSAPPELGSSLAVEKSTLLKSAGLCVEIAADFTRHDDTAANTAITRLFATASSLSATARQHAAVAAVRAYNARLSQISTLTSKLKAERQSLLDSLS